MTAHLASAGDQRKDLMGEILEVREHPPPCQQQDGDDHNQLQEELFLGFLLGMVVSFFFYIHQLAGSMIDTQMGMTRWG